jgi:hypothetical protein
MSVEFVRVQDCQSTQAAVNAYVEAVPRIVDG